MQRQHLGAVSALTLTACAALSLAGTIRHDVSDDLYIEKGESYPAAAFLGIGEASGTGVLISPQWILTAAHVAEDAANGALALVGEYYVFPDYVLLPDEYDSELGPAAGWDIALVHLPTSDRIPTASEDPDGIDPMQLDLNPNISGQNAYWVGYGVTGYGMNGFDDPNNPDDEPPYDFNIRAVQNKLNVANRTIIPDFLTEEIASQFWIADFDDPATGTPIPVDGGGGTYTNDGRDTLLDGPLPLPLEGSVAPGDSGGPVFFDHDNNPATPDRVVGVNSFIEALDPQSGPGDLYWGDAFDNASYSDLMGATRLSKMSDFLGQMLSGRLLPNPSDAITDVGDTDLDGDVDLSDLGALASAYGWTGIADWINGDFDNDGDVDLNDLGSLATNYGAGSAQALVDFQMLTGVPEPGTLSLTILCAAATLQRRRKSSP